MLFRFYFQSLKGYGCSLKKHTGGAHPAVRLLGNKNAPAVIALYPAAVRLAYRDYIRNVYGDCGAFQRMKAVKAARPDVKRRIELGIRFKSEGFQHNVILASPAKICNKENGRKMRPLYSVLCNTMIND